MNTEAALLRAISEAGDEFTPRLVFADWLQEHEQPERAAFIRDQVLVATTPTDTPERRAAARRAFDVERKFGKRWAGPIARHCHDWQYRAGFPDMIGLTLAKLKRNGANLFAHTPIRSLLVTKLAGNVVALDCIPARNSITRLSLWGAQLTPNLLPQVAARANLPRLHTLSLLFNHLDDSSIELLTSDAFFERLTRIELGANPFTESGRDRLRAALGERVTFECHREDDYLFRIEDDDPFFNGIAPDGVQYVTRDGREGHEVARFDLAGNLLSVERDPEGGSEDVGYLESLGAKPATVRVKRFAHSDGRGIRGMPGLVELFENPATDSNPTFTQEVLDGWLIEGEYAFGNCILNRAGEVTAT